MGTPLLLAEGISKGFSGVAALTDVHFAVEPGEVHALVGENGAGKSTLVKILTGVYPPDGGRVTWDGRLVTLPNPLAAYRLGIAVIHQERQLIPSFTVAENLFLGRPYPRRRGGLAVDWQAMRRRAGEIMADLGVSLPLDVPVAQLTPATRTMAELLRANLFASRLLFLDEPTAALTDQETRALFGLIRRLQARGTAFVYVSHRLEEIVELADRVTVLRNGRHVATVPAAGMEKRELVALISGQPVGAVGPVAGEPVAGEPVAGEPVATGAAGAGAGGAGAQGAGAAPDGPAAGTSTGGRTPEPLLAVRELATRDGRVRSASFTLHRGEVLGLFGLAGAGRTELLAALYGDAPHTGTVELAGRPVAFGHPAQALAAGVALIPEDRRGHALVMDMNIRENISLPVLGRYRRGPGVIDRRREVAEVQALMDDLGVKATGPEQGVATLSGGNQQKVVLAKTLSSQPQVFLCDEPTQAVDVMTRREIHQRLRQLAAGGAGVLFVSSDLNEVLEVSDRLLVMRAGQIVACLEATGTDPETVLQICYGEDE